MGTSYMQNVLAAEREPDNGDFSPRYSDGEPLERLISPRDFGWANVLPSLLGRLPARGRFLDIGSGSGVVTTLVASLGLEAVGLEGAASGVRLSHRHAKLMGVTGASFVRADLEADAPLPVDGLFHLAFASEILEHIENDVGLMARIRDCLEPGGVLIATSPSEQAILHRIRKRAGGDAYDVARGHVRRYNRRSFAEHAEQAGFTGIQVEPIAGAVREVLFSSRHGMALNRFVRRPLTPTLQALDRLTIAVGESQLMLICCAA
jgi:SAM-dependent methyltransferase